MKTLILNSLLIFFSISSCKNNQKSQTRHIKTQSVPHECVLLNDSAFKYITRYTFKHNSKDLDTALLLLKQATLCDTSYFIAYSNMANTYDLMENFQGEIQTLNKMATIKKNNWWILTRKGLTYKKLDDTISAKRIYRFVDSLSQVKMEKDPENALLIMNYITFKTIAYGKNAGTQELNTQIKKHPALKSRLINSNVSQ